MWVQRQMMMLYFVGILRREAGTLGASDISSKLCIITANLRPHTSAKIKQQLEPAYCSTSGPHCQSPPFCSPGPPLCHPQVRR